MNNKIKIRVVTFIVVTLLLLFLISFGYFYVSSNQSDRNRLTGGCFNTSFSDQNSINLTGAMPEAFDDAKKNTKKYVEEVMAALNGGDDRFKTE